MLMLMLMLILDHGELMALLMVKVNFRVSQSINWSSQGKSRAIVDLRMSDAQGRMKRSESPRGGKGTEGNLSPKREQNEVVFDQ